MLNLLQEVTVKMQDSNVSKSNSMCNGLGKKMVRRERYDHLSGTE